MKKETMVWVTDMFEGFHRWKDAPPDVAFLKHYHRHLFYVKVGLNVSQPDREIEFFMFKRKLRKHLIDSFEGLYFDKSCEMIAEELCIYFNASWVEVSEDNENGAIAYNNMIKKEYCFIGIEAEGPNRGASVLFVPGRVRAEELQIVLDKSSTYIQRIYYGAGNDRDICLTNLKILGKFIKSNPHIKLDVEIDNITDINLIHRSKETGVITKDASLIFYKKSKGIVLDILNKVDFIKTIINDVIRWEEISTKESYHTFLDDLLFKTDTPIN